MAIPFYVPGDEEDPVLSDLLCRVADAIQNLRFVYSQIQAMQPSRASMPVSRTAGEVQTNTNDNNNNIHHEHNVGLHQSSLPHLSHNLGMLLSAAESQIGDVSLAPRALEFGARFGQRSRRQQQQPDCGPKACVSIEEPDGPLVWHPADLKFDRFAPLALKEESGAWTSSPTVAERPARDSLCSRKMLAKLLPSTTKRKLWTAAIICAVGCYVYCVR